MCVVLSCILDQMYGLWIQRSVRPINIILYLYSIHSACLPSVERVLYYLLSHPSVCLWIDVLFTSLSSNANQLRMLITFCPLANITMATSASQNKGSFFFSIDLMNLTLSMHSKSLPIGYLSLISCKNANVVFHRILYFFFYLYLTVIWIRYSRI